MHVAFQVTDSNQGLVQGIGNGLGGCHAHQQGANQTRPLGHGNGVDFLPGHARFLQGLGNHRQNGLHMATRGQFRHHSAVRAVNRDLAGNHIGKDDPAIPDYGGSRFIA